MNVIGAKSHYLLIALVLLAGAKRAAAQNGVPTMVRQQELTASNGAPVGFFGLALALSSDGTTALIGAPDSNIGGNASQGAAYVFVRSGSNWVQRQELTSADGATGDSFGASPALNTNGNMALIGADRKTIGSNPQQGAAYLFTHSGSNWVQQQELTLADGAALDGFGSSLALTADGGTGLIGAPGKQIGVNSGQGAAYVFVAQTGAPNLLIVSNGSNSVMVSWPNTGSYTLQQSSNLLGGIWTTNSLSITTNNGTNSVTITPAVGNLFFRLLQP